jgi:hypothetical protein
VALVRPDISEERIATIRVTRIGELVIMLAVIEAHCEEILWEAHTVFLCSMLQLLVIADVPNSLILVTLMMEAMCFSETLVLIRATRHHIPEDGILHVQRD